MQTTAADKLLLKAPDMLWRRGVLLEKAFAYSSLSKRQPRRTANMGTGTRAAYQHDEALIALQTRVTAISKASTLPEAENLLFRDVTDDECVVEVAETVFYAQGGGQPFDTGTMKRRANGDREAESIFQVRAVRSAAEGRILHLGKFGSGLVFAVGDEVLQDIDENRRTLNSRYHTAGHLVGLAVRHLASTIPGMIELKAQHYPGAAFVEFRGLIEGKHKDAIQAKADEFFEAKLPVKVYWWDEKTLRERCAVVPAAVEMPAENGGLIRAVDVVGAGAYPCGGTHVKHTGAVGKVVVRRITRQKGISKISYGLAEVETKS